MSYPLAHFNAAVDSVVEGAGHEGIRFHLTLGIVHGCKEKKRSKVSQATAKSHRTLKIVVCFKGC